MATTAAIVWQPQDGRLAEICALLEQQISPFSVFDKSQIWKQLQHFSQIPDFNNYLVFILVRAEGKSVEVRQAAGLLLKNNLRDAYSSMSQKDQKYIKSELLAMLGVADRNIRTTIGTVISVVVQIEGASGWPEIWPALVTSLDSNELDRMDGAMDALSKICEDTPYVLDSEVPLLSERPINIFLPRLYQFSLSPDGALRKLALGSVNQCIKLVDAALYDSMNMYLDRLFVLANDPVAQVRKLACAAFVYLTEVFPSSIEPHLSNVMEYMLQVNKDPDEDVVLKACEFWSAYGISQLPPEKLREFLPRLIPVLLSNMAYADDDESLLDAEDFDDDDDDWLNVWNLRKCSEAAIKVLSNVFRDEILPALKPLIVAKLSASGDEAWKDREAAVLALGAIAEGCIDGLYPHLSEIVTILLPLLDDKFPLIRSISCWTLSRFIKYLVQECGNEKGDEQFGKVLMGLLHKLLDTNKRVQEAACSAFATLEKDAAEELVPHLGVILQHLMDAFGKYQNRNVRMVYNAIGTLADSVGEELNKPAYLEILMPPLVAKLQQLSDSDKDLFPLLECFTSVSEAIGVGFGPFADPVLQGCKGIIKEQKLAKTNHLFTEDCSLDAIISLAQGLVGSLTNPPLMESQRKRRKVCTKTNEEVDVVTAIRRHIEVLNSSFCSESAHKDVEEAAAAISALAKIDENVETIVGNGAIPALVQYLESPWSSKSCNHKLEKDCAFALGLIAASQGANQQLIVDAGAIVPTVNLLKRRNLCCGCLSANAVINRAAADLISRIAHDNPRIKTNIRDEGGIPPLVALLDFPDDTVQRAAAGALRRLSFGDNQNKNLIVELNALPALVLMLQSGDNSVHGEAIGAIRNLVPLSPVIRARALGPVINLLSSPCLETQKEAAFLIGHFAAPGSDCKVHIAQRGATTPLINMLQSSDEQVLEASAFALGRLAQDPHTQASIGHKGGITSLLNLLDVDNVAVQYNAAFVLYRLAAHEENIATFIKLRAIQKLEDGNFTVEANKNCVVRTLRKLEEKIHQRPVLNQLLYLMRTREKTMQIEIACSLAYLCVPKDCKFIFIDNKGLQILLDLLDSLSIKQQRYGSSALFRLANKAKCFAPEDSDAIPSLKQLSEDAIEEDLCVENIQRMYKLAEKFNASALRQACMLFILEHFTQLIWFPNFIKKVKPQIRSWLTDLLTRPVQASSTIG